MMPRERCRSAAGSPLGAGGGAGSGAMPSERCASMRPGANRRDHGPDTGCHTISSCAALCERSPNVLTASPAEPLNPTLIRYRHWSARSAGGHSGRVGLAVELTRRTRAGGGQGRRVEVVTDGCPLRGGRSSRAGRRVLTARGGAIVGSSIEPTAGTASSTFFGRYRWNS